MKDPIPRHHPLALAIALAIPLATTIATPAFAATALEEVIVTAQKREQNLQKVPIAVTSFNAEELFDKGIATIIDVEKSVPNTQLRASRGTNSTLTAFIRGVGQQDPLWGFEPGVGVYIDDVYIARPQGAILDILDIERLEILRGPQGTLYGKNTVGGAIKYVTRKMEGGYAGNISASVGSFNQHDFKVSSQIPLVEDTLYFGYSVASLNRDGFGTQFKDYVSDGAALGDIGTFGRTEENYNKEILAARAAIEFTPTDELFFKIAADQVQDDSNNRCGSRFDTSIFPGPNGEVFPATENVFDSFCGTTEEQEVEIKGYSFTAKYDVSDELSLKYVFAEREGDTRTFIDFDGTPLDTFDVPALYDDEQTTHELQFNLETDGLALVGGFYYFDGTAAGAFDSLFGAFSPTGVLSGTQFSNAVSGEVDTESSAVYLNAEISLTSTVTLTLGGRYTKDEKAADVNRVFLFTNNSFPGTNNQGSGFTFGDPADDLITAVRTNFTKDEANNEWEEFTPSVKISWEASDDILLYTSYARGFKSGGFDMRADAAAASFNVPGISRSPLEGFNPETVDAYEIGLKSQLFDDRLRFNLNLFRSEYNDQQVGVQTPALPPAFFDTRVINAAESTIQGIEFESTLQVLDNLIVNFAFGYLDAEFDSVNDVAAVGLDDTGAPVFDFVDRSQPVEALNIFTGQQVVLEPWGPQNAPEFTGQLGVSYILDLGDYGAFTYNAAASYRDDVRMFETVTSIIDQEAYTLLDVGIIWNSSDDHWTAALHGRNITDREYRTGGYNFPGTAGENSIVGFYGDPRTWTLTLGYDF